MKITKIAAQVLVLCLMGSNAFAASDSATATVNLSGNVPVVFSLTALGIPGDIDFTPGASVNNRVLALLHLKYNESMTTLKVSSVAGNFKNGATAYNWAAAGGTAPVLSVDGACTSITSASFVWPITALGTDISSAGAKALTAGKDEYCQLQGTWVVPTVSPLAGVYALDVTFTMTGP